MTSHSLWNAAAVEQAVAQLAALRPAYASILGFYGPVFAAQIHAAGKTFPEAIPIDQVLLEMKSNEGFPLIEPAAFTVDFPAAEKLLVQICDIAMRSGEKLGAAGEALTRALSGGFVMAGLFADVLGDKGRIADLARTMDVSPEMLSLLLYLAVKPSVEAGARQLAVRLTGSPKNQGSCPVCGSAPLIGELDAEGRQWIHCGVCWHRWAVTRMVCPFCSNRDSASLEYLFSDDEPEYRVNLCGECKRYLKVADTRKMDRRFYPPLEQVASLHLDMLAAEKGYAPARGVTFPTADGR
ncbi:formate dehydrogenase accessory protein FdhE [uncultured Desulfosarcina sp.]|uniref:formate dehydrogenase accessory protein FdhE n=1 Tax=uncultured Desulfosarcina sp. TaxID=218289 RepID=UPI0029C8E4B6|nr:formate dehydrogenase accessory protein FdhE [uncultured Desulfosarcina sp.]